MPKAAFTNHEGSLPEEAPREPCGRCGHATVVKMLQKGRRGRPEVMYECPACGWLRPAYQSRWGRIDKNRQRHETLPSS